MTAARQPHFLVLVVLAAAVGCNDGGGARADSAAGREAASLSSERCGTATTSAHEDADALLREWVRRDAEGELLQGGAWFTGAVECPGREAPAAPAFTIVAQYRIDSVVVRDSLAVALVRWQRVGYVTGAGTNHAGFDALPGVVSETVRARRTPHGWRVVGPAPRGLVLYSAFPVRQALGPAAHALVVQMAEQAKRSSAPPGGG